MLKPVVAAISLDRRDGGVAVASRLLWQAVRSHTDGQATLVELAESRPESLTFHPGLRSRLRFSARLVMAQASRRCPWILFAHPAVARVQGVVPSPARVPYAVFIHGIEVWRPLSSARRRVLRNASMRLANSEFTARRTVEMHPDIGPVVACPLALPPGAYAESAPQEAPPHPIVLIVARMHRSERYKGHDQLLECWPAVVAARPGARLVMVGEGDDAPRLREKATTLGIGSSVVFPGFVSDVALGGWYRQASVFAMPSRGEGFGLVYLEAMAHGLPCVGSDEDAAREIIVDGETGYLVKQSDQAALRDRLIGLLTDATLRRTLGLGGRARLAREFSYDRFSSRLGTALDAAFGMPARRAEPSARSSCA
jgi:phosphatidylinositol alpha-1,6-mannosyltransferase